MQCCLAHFNHTLSHLYYPTSLIGCTNTTINELPDDLVAEILVRLPPCPRHVLAISEACTKWRQLIGSNHFRTITLSHHGGFPLLGLFTNSTEDKRFVREHYLDPNIFQMVTIPTESQSGRVYVLACRNGMVLLNSPDSRSPLVTWDPIRNIKMNINKPPCWWMGTYDNATILCSRNHDCHSSNFWIVWISTSICFGVLV